MLSNDLSNSDTAICLEAARTLARVLRIKLADAQLRIRAAIDEERISLADSDTTASDESVQPVPEQPKKSLKYISVAMSNRGATRNAARGNRRQAALEIKAKRQLAKSAARKARRETTHERAA